MMTSFVEVLVNDCILIIIATRVTDMYSAYLGFWLSRIFSEGFDFLKSL